MDLHGLPALAAEYQTYADMAARMARGETVQVEGLPVAAKALLLAQWIRDSTKPLIIVTYNMEQAERLASDLQKYGVGSVALLPSSTETLFFAEGVPDIGALGRRTSALQALARGAARIVVGPVGAWLQRTVPADLLRDRRVELVADQTADIGAIEKSLVDYGYERVEAVEQPGQWTRRGGILDLFPGDASQPYRVDFFGDDIESIRPFDVESQRSAGRVERVTVAPIREIAFADVAVQASATVGKSLAGGVQPLASGVQQLYANVQEAVDTLARELPARVKVLRQANEEGKGGEHGERLEERVEGDIAQLNAHAYFDRVEYYLPYLYPQAVCALDYISKDAVVVLDEPSQARARQEQTEREIGEISDTRVARGELLAQLVPHEGDFARVAQAVTDAPAAVLFSLLSRGTEGIRVAKTLATQAGAMESFVSRLPAFFEAVEGWLSARFRVVLVTEQAARMRELLAERKMPTSPAERLTTGEAGVYVIDGALPGGFKLPEARVMLATDADIFGHGARAKTPRRTFKEGLKITSYLELREGDFVVHINHGIGRYAGISRLKGPDGAQRDYLLLQYAENDKVYVPTDQVDRVQKYIGSADSPPEITRLNSGEWARATGKAKRQVQEMAADLIKLYAARKAATGHAMLPDTPWQTEMEEAFPYQETPDQLAAIEDVKRDLEDDKPMDRLICGDVGYGKTEVAIRAAFKVVNGGRQVAVLCPTTILAQQHLKTFRERLAAYPVNVQMLSRFVSKAEAAETLRGLEDSTVDIVIGTHKLLGKDVKFHKLGLLVVDEEQRFGVTHKERIKQMKRTVDVLTLTATPIPRTLHMSLSGIRDMSLIDDPPEGRKPIKTFVKEYDDELIREVILRELDRNGQIYFLHNRVESISHISERIRRLVPAAKVEFAHGQMHEDNLEDVMVRFASGAFNVLVCTTIVESGLDIGNVNTIIVDNADKLGLAQLYQLRGRIGRSNRQGYAYLLFRKDKQLTEVAEKRLGALQEFSDLGSGYKVALRDLEIRGAGNLLGAAQSGTVSTVGFDLYTQLLSQAINEMRGDEPETERDLPNVALPLDALIPAAYIPSEAERILMYKKLAAVRTMDTVARVQEELEDRYGDPPKVVWNLLAILRLRLRSKEVGIGSIVAEKRRVAIRFQGTHLLADTIKKLARIFGQHQFLPDVVFLATSDQPAKMLQAVEEMVETLAGALPPVLKAEKPKAAVRPSAAGDKPAAAPAKPPKPKPASANGDKPTASGDNGKADAGKERNLVSNQVSARRRGTYNRGR